MNEAHAQFVSGVRSFDHDWIAVDENVPSVRRSQACKNADQGRLAGAVCAHKAMSFAGQNGQGRAAQRLGATIGFADPDCGHECGCRRRPRHRIFHRNSGSHCSAAGCSARNFSIVSEVTRTAGTSTAFGIQSAPAFTISGRSVIMLWPSV